MKKVVYKVDGIRNDTEKLQMKRALDKVTGVQEIAIDRAESSVEVKYNPPATEEAITDKLESTGHDSETIRSEN